MREAVRLELASLSSAWSIVFNPRRKVLDCALTDLQAEVKRYFTRLARIPALNNPQSVPVPQPQPSSCSSAGTNV
jgi:RNase P protein component